MPGRNVTISNQAIHWFVRLHSGDCTETERRQFFEWLTRDDTHRREYQRVAAMWTEMDGLKDTVPVAPAEGQCFVEVRLPQDSPHHGSLRRRLAPRAALAMAAVIIVVLAGTWLWTKPAVYQTAKGERKTVTLFDDSSIALNTDTAVSAQVLPWRRTVTMDHGEALFTIAPDANRPFTVAAGAGTIQVLGTIFNVYKKTDQVVVTVLEGTVQITTDTGEDNHKGKRESRIITQGQQLAYTETGNLMPIKLVHVNTSAAWREGKMIFDETRLTEVLAKVSRYHTVELRLADPKLSELKVSGVFQSENLDGLLHTITQILPVTAQQLSENLIVLSPGAPKRNSPAPAESSPYFRMKPRL
jgi:transmembrane sensor